MPDKAQFLADIRSENADVRFAAWRAAGDQEADVIAELGKLAAGHDPGVAKAATEALTTLVHSVGKDTASAKRPLLVKELLELAASSSSLRVRFQAYRLLSLIAGENDVPAIAKSIQQAEVQEEVAFCLERIPGNASMKALLAAYPNAANAFKPRILAALGHLRAAEGLPLVLSAMRSPDKEIAIAATKAFGRIGRKPAQPPQFPPLAGLSEWQKIDHMDSRLRYADAQVAAGNHAEAMKVYREALDRPEEHWQCAGIIGIARMGTPEAATAIFPKLKSADRKVRITAQNAWKAMAGA